MNPKSLSFSRVHLQEAAILINQPLPFVSEFIEALNAGIQERKPGSPGLSRCQRWWLGICLMGIMITNTVCWARVERATLGQYSLAALSWMFRHAKLPWEWLLQLSVRVLLRRYRIEQGVLVIDDSDKKRTKVTRRIAHVHKLKDKASGGFIMGQSLVFLLLVTASVTIPVGFAFYCPDPVRSAWAKQDKALRKKGIPKRKRPAEPARNPAYPTKAQLALQLLAQFHQDHPMVQVKCVLADALYGTEAFMDAAAAIFGGVQVISQLRNNQNIRFRNRTLSVAQYFARYPGVPQALRIRGGETVSVMVSSARLHVCAHGQKRFVIARQYEGETEYRYLVASDLTWRTQDIVQVATLRWLIEVFIQDWKAHEGWGTLTKQPGEEGSSRSLILSLLVDHCLLLHPDQLAQFERKQPAYTVGSLINRIKVESLLDVIGDIVASDHPAQQLAQLAERLTEQNALAPSEKHMIGRDLGRMEPTPSLKYKAAA